MFHFPARNHIVHMCDVLLSLVRDSTVLYLGCLGLWVVRVVVEHLIRCFKRLASDGIACAANALETGLDIVYESGHGYFGKMRNEMYSGSGLVEV